MSIDMSQFYQVFFEEAAELLAEMETLLVSMDTSAPGQEDLNAIFRAAHSIKGGAGTFGFTDMTEITHVLESLLDRLRKGELALRNEMVDAFLKAGDVLKTQLASHRGDGVADEAGAAAVCETLKQLAVREGGAAPAAAQPVTQAAQAAPAAGNGIFHIEFTVSDANGSTSSGNAPDIERLLSNLADFGTLDVLQAPPPDAARDVPGQYRLRLATRSSEEDVWEALAFTVDPAHLKIEAGRSVGPAGKTDTVPSPGEVASALQNAAVSKGAVADMDNAYFGKLYEAIVSPESGIGTEHAAVYMAPAAHAAAEPGYATQARSPGQRASDNPDAPVARTGRRETDKIAVAGQTETSSIRVSIDKVDQLINLVGELVITQAMLAQTASQVDPVLYEKLLNSLGQLERNTRDLQEAVMSIRMMPISFVFSRFPRVARDLAAKLGKQVELRTVGEGTELDKGLIEKIADPLTHLVRNSLDHGIELPEARESAGKPAKGNITLRAFHQGGNVIIEVSDDGRGLNREKILAKARQNGMAVSDAMSDQEVWQLIFEAGFSTAEVVTDVSGRGVGMDVVKRNIQALGGRVEINSAAGEGTRITICLPLTLAILDGLSVSVGGELFIVPLTYIVESLQPVAAEVKTVSGRGRVVHVRGEYLPLVALHEVFNIQPEVSEVSKGIIVILEAEGHKTAMFVDALVGQHQVVIKSLETNYRRVQGISGATIMGDGKVALILDAVAIGREAQGAMAEAA